MFGSYVVVEAFFILSSPESRILNAFNMLYTEGGPRGLWRGNGMNIIKIAPESALKFASYDLIKRYIRGDSTRDMFIYERFLAGSMAGGISQSIIYPLEVSEKSRV